MLRNYLLTAWRNFLRHRLNAVINLLGLSVAFVSSLLLFLMVFTEFTFDRIHRNGQSLFEVYGLSHPPDKDEKRSSMTYPMAATLKAQVPGILRTTGYMQTGNGIRFKDKDLDKSITLVDNDFFSMFSFPAASGAGANALAGLDNVVLSQSTATAVFGNEDPIGKVVKVRVNTVWKDLTVTAVLKDPPENSSIQFDILARMELNPEYAANKNSWNNFNHLVFVQTAPGFSAKQVEASMRPLEQKYFTDEEKELKQNAYGANANGDRFTLKLIPFADMHFDESLSLSSTVSMNYLYTLILIAGVVLVIACFNFINLNVARAFTRAREVGIRKTLGASKRQVFLQLWTESFFLCILALFIGLTLSAAVMGGFNDLFQENLKMKGLLDPLVVATIMAAILVISLLAGGYPALLVSRYNPVTVLKGKVSVNRSSLLRNGLITFQFVLASILICGTIVIYKQFQHLRTAPLGYDQESVISIPVKNTDNTRRYIDELRARLAAEPQVVSVTGGWSNVGLGSDGSISKWSQGFIYKGKTIHTMLQAVGFDYFSTLGIKPLAGREFSRDFRTDTSSTETSVVITESLARQLGGKDLIGYTFYPDSTQPKWKIIGIIPDIHMYSMYEKGMPVTFRIDNKISLNYILVKVKTNNPLQAMNVVKAGYKTIEPDNSVSPSYVSENTRRWYDKERRLSSIFFSAAGLAIMLSCLGLFAMVSLVLDQRRKEIGVRKVLGASVAGVTVLMSKSFLRLIALAFVIAVPIAWYFLNQWLQSFVYRTAISWWIFPLAGVLSIVIALATIGFQTVRAALANPVESLRAE